MLLPTTTEATRLAFEPREKSDGVRGCTLLCALGDDDLAAKIDDLKRLRGAFTHLLVLADAPVAEDELDEAGLRVWHDKWPISSRPTRDRTDLSALAVRNIELLGSLGFELHLALFNADAAEAGMTPFLGSCDATGLAPAFFYYHQLLHEIQFVRGLIAKPCIKHITGILPCFGGEKSEAGDFTLRLVNEIKGCGYTGSILQNLDGEARTLFGPKFRRAGVLSVCNLTNAGAWVRTACDIRSALGFTVPPVQTVTAVSHLCNNPGAVGYYLDFGAYAGVALPDSVLIAAGATPSKVQEEDPIPLPEAPVASVAPGGPSEASQPLWKPAHGGSSALVRIPDNTPRLGGVNSLCRAALSHGTHNTYSDIVERVTHNGVPVLVYRFTTPIPAGPANLGVVRPDVSAQAFQIMDMHVRQIMTPVSPLAWDKDMPSDEPAYDYQEPGGVSTATHPAEVPEAPAPVATEVVENLLSGRLTIPTSWYTQKPSTVKYAYDVNGAKYRSLQAQEVAPGVFELGTPVSHASHRTGAQPNMWILKFTPKTVVDTLVPVHEIGHWWYVYIENGKPRDR